jgi:hypothetical protein
MKELQTILGTEVPISTRGILYLCILKNHKLTVVRELFFTSGWEAMNAYANIPNPESQLVTGKTYDELIKALHILHENIKDTKWIKELENCI